MPALSPRARGLLAWTLLLGTALALRLVNLDRSLWFDEVCMSSERIGTLGQLASTLYADIHPPLFVVFMHVWDRVVGESEVLLRLPALLCGLATMPLCFVVGRRLVGARAAAWATVLLCLSPTHVWYSIEARVYAPVMLLALVAVELFHRLLEGQSGRALRLAWLATLVVMVGLHYYLAVFVLLLGALGWWLARRRDEPRLARWYVLSSGAALALVAAWVGFRLAFAGFETSQGYLRALSFQGLYELLFQWFWTGNGLVAGLGEPSTHPRWMLWVGFQMLGIVLFMQGLFRMGPTRRELPWSRLTLVYLLALPLFLLVLPWFGLGNTYIERSCLPALPFFFMLVGSGLVALRGRALQVLAGAAVLALSATNLWAYYHYDEDWTVYKPNADLRSVAAWLGAEVDAGGAGRPVYTALPHPRTLSFYDERIQHARNLVAPSDGMARAAEGLESKLGSTVGGRLASLARSLSADLLAEQERRREVAHLFVYDTGDGSVAGLRLEERGVDRTFYLVSTRFHPPGDRTANLLLASPELRVLESRSFPGARVHKLRLAD